MRSDNVQDSTTPSSRHLFSRHAPILLFVLSFVWPLPYYIVWKLEKMNKHVHRSHSTDSSGRVFSCGTESLNALLERHRAAWVAFDVQGCSNHCNLSTAAFRILGKNNYYILRKKKKTLVSHIKQWIKDRPTGCIESCSNSHKQYGKVLVTLYNKVLFCNIS